MTPQAGSRGQVTPLHHINSVLLNATFAEQNCSSCQEYLRPTEDQLHITDDPTSGSGSGRAPSPD